MQGKCVIVMGVSGSGKSTVGAAVAQMMRAVFIEGDSLHPEENIEKMHRGIPLTDDDRQGWLEKIHAIILQTTGEGKDCVVSCSALKRRYRAVLREDVAYIVFIYLQGSYDLIYGWLAKRNDHFMPATLLKSQFADLEEPAADETDVITIPLREDFGEEAQEVERGLQKKGIL